MRENQYIVVVQCHIVKERCSGYFCEKAFYERKGKFSGYSKEKTYRTLYFTCGGCCGRAVHRKLADLLRSIKKKEGVDREKIVVHLSSCIVNDNYHGPQCPHLDYLKDIIVNKLKLGVVEGTKISEVSEKRREKGGYSKNND